MGLMWRFEDVLERRYRARETGQKVAHCSEPQECCPKERF